MRRIQEKLERYAAQLALLDEIPGVDWTLAAVINIAELGVDMTVFDNAGVNVKRFLAERRSTPIWWRRARFSNSSPTPGQRANGRPRTERQRVLQEK